jgi:hypothetical protein
MFTAHDTMKIQHFAGGGYGASIASVMDVTTGCDQYHSHRK